MKIGPFDSEGFRYCIFVQLWSNVLRHCPGVTAVKDLPIYMMEGLRSNPQMLT